MDGYRFPVDYGSVIILNISFDTEMKCPVFGNTLGTIQPNGPTIKIIPHLKIKILVLDCFTPTYLKYQHPNKNWNVIFISQHDGLSVLPIVKTQI